jgi:hypothetical protein
MLPGSSYDRFWKNYYRDHEPWWFQPFRWLMIGLIVLFVVGIVVGEVRAFDIDSYFPDGEPVWWAGWMV